jgi:hypothetical protein
MMGIDLSVGGRVDLGEIGCKDVGCIHLAQDRDQ